MLNRPRGELEPNDERRLSDLNDPLQFKRQQDLGIDLRLLLHVEPNPLDGLAHQFDVGARFEAKIKLYRCKVAALIGHSAERAIGNRVQRSIVMPQLDRANTERLDGAFQSSGIDVFTDSK